MANVSSTTESADSANQEEELTLSDDETRSLEQYLSSDDTDQMETIALTTFDGENQFQHLGISETRKREDSDNLRKAKKASQKIKPDESIHIRLDVKDSRKNHERHMRKRRTFDEYLSYPDQLEDGNRVVEWSDSDKNEMQERVVDKLPYADGLKIAHKTSFQLDSNQSSLYDALQNILQTERQHSDILAELIKAKDEIASNFGRNAPTQLFDKLMEIQLLQGWLVLVIEGWQKAKKESLEELIDRLHCRQEKLVQYANMVPPILQTLKNKRDQSKSSTMAQYHIDSVQKPMTWITQSIEYIKLLKTVYTPNDANFEKLMIAEEELFGASSDLVFFSSKIKDQGEPLKSSLVVELKKPPSKERRLRTLFLFDKVLASAHQRVILLKKHFTEGEGNKLSENVDTFYDSDSASVNSKATADLSSLKMEARSFSRFELKWFIPLDQLGSLSKDGVAFDDDMLRDRLANIESLKTKIKETRAELLEERRSAQNESKIQKLKAPKIHRLRSFLYELQAQLILQSPKLPLLVNSTDDREFCILFNSERERMDWINAIQQAKNNYETLVAKERLVPKKSNTLRSITSHLRPTSKPASSEVGNRLSSGDVSHLINRCKNTVQLNHLGAILISGSAISGLLQVTVHEIDALDDISSYYVSIEVDFFGQLELVAKTRSVSDSANPIFNQTFMVELDCSQLISFSIHRKNAVIGQLQLSLDSETLEQYSEKSHTIRTFEPSPRLINIKISLSFTEQSEAFLRNHSLKGTSVFGQALTDVVNRDQLRSDNLHKIASANQSELALGVTRKDIFDTATVSVPIIVTSCVEEIERRGLQEEGLYRISGSTTSVAYLKEQFDRDIKMALKQLGDYDVNVLTSLLKLFFRELPQPLIDRTSFLDFIHAMDIDNDEAKGKAFGKIIRKLQPPAEKTFVYLINHLLTVSAQEKINKMHFGNLALVWAMNLFQSNMTTDDKSACSALQSKKNVCSATGESMIQTELMLQILKLHKKELINFDYTNF